MIFHYHQKKAKINTNSGTFYQCKVNLFFVSSSEFLTIKPLKQPMGFLRSTTERIVRYKKTFFRNWLQEYRSNNCNKNNWNFSSAIWYVQMSFRTSVFIFDFSVKINVNISWCFKNLNVFFELGPQNNQN